MNTGGAADMVPLREYFEALLKEKDLRDQQRYDAQIKALEAALLAQKDAVTTAMISSEKAVIKAETAAERRFESVNEFRAQLADQATSFMPRGEAEQRLSALAEKIDSLSTIFNEKIDSLKELTSEASGRASGLHTGWGILVGGVGMIISIIVLAIALI